MGTEVVSSETAANIFKHWVGSLALDVTFMHWKDDNLKVKHGL